MKRAAPAMMVLAGEAIAHPGHGAPDSHLHGWGAEHVALIVAVLTLVLIFKRK